MKIVVTGSHGFIGGHVVKALLAQGHVVVMADKKVGVDMADLATARKVITDSTDAIIHLASTCSTPGSVLDPAGTFRDTVVTAANVLDAARSHRIPVLLTSSVKARDGKTPYGAAKRMVELWAREHSDAYEFPVVINRPGTVYGPGQEGSTESGWVAWFLKAKREGLQVVINGDGKQVRDLLHVDDYVALLMKQLKDPRTWGTRIWDVGGGPRNAVTVLELAQHLGLDHVHGPDRYGDVREYVGHNATPSWQPQVYWKETGMFR